MVQPRRETPHQPQTSQFSAQLKMFLVQLLQQRPLIFWGGIWAIALMLISGSIATLLDPTVSRHVSLRELFPPSQPIAAPSPVDSAAPAPAVLPSATPIAAPPVAIEANQPTVPYRSLGAIVLGCGAGSIVILQLMNRSPQPQRLRTTPPAAKRPPAAQPPKPLVNPPQPQSQPQPAAIAPATYQMPPALTTPRSTRRATTEQAALPVVTVVPTETSHALDWDENSLVNAMDIRKRRSLSSWM